jgi:hypothetical protein
MSNSVVVNKQISRKDVAHLLRSWRHRNIKRVGKKYPFLCRSVYPDITIYWYNISKTIAINILKYRDLQSCNKNNQVHEITCVFK